MAKLQPTSVISKKQQLHFSTVHRYYRALKGEHSSQTTWLPLQGRRTTGHPWPCSRRCSSSSSSIWHQPKIHLQQVTEAIGPSPRYLFSKKSQLQYLTQPEDLQMASPTTTDIHNQCSLKIFINVVSTLFIRIFLKIKCRMETD